jgi:plastocyanin
MRTLLVTCCLAAVSVLSAYIPAGATLHIVNQSGLSFVPDDLTVEEGDTVRWVWDAGSHTVTSGAGAADPNAGSLFDAPLTSVNTTFQYVFNTAGTYPYFCRPHEGFGMKGTITVDVPSSVRAPVATIAALRQNRPNPFEGLTEITYTLSQGAHVRLGVYDARGRLVANLDEGFRGPGVHTAAWGGSGAGGVRSPAGVYFYRLQAGTEVATRKLTLVR